MLIFPLGRAWARLLPNVKIFGLELNPGPFTIKEHVLATIMASVGAGSAYATDIIAVQRVFYNQNYNFSCALNFPLFRVLSDAENCRSMDGCHVHSAHRFLYRWHCPSLPRAAALYE